MNFCALLSHTNAYVTYACVRAHTLPVAISNSCIMTSVIIAITKVLLLLIHHKATVSLWIPILSFIATIIVHVYELTELLWKN